MAELSYEDALVPAQKPQELSYEDAAKPAPAPGWSLADNPVTRIGKAFGAGFGETWGDYPGLTPENTKWLSEKGVFAPTSGYLGISGLGQAFNEVILESAARLPTVFFGAFHGSQEAVVQIGKEVGMEKLARDVAALPEAFAGSPHPTGTPSKSVARAEAFNKHLAQIEEAGEIGVLKEPKPDPTFNDSPHELAERAVPQDLGAAKSPEEVRQVMGHELGEYDARGKAWVDKIDAPEDVRKAVEQIASENDYFPQARAGEASVAARDAVAEAAGVAAGDLDSAQFSTHFDTDGKVRAIVQVLRQTAKDYVDASKKAADEPTPENLAAAAEAEQRHTHVLEYVMGARAESGRSLAAWKDLLRQTEETKAKVALQPKEQTGEVPKGTGAVIDAVAEVREGLKNPEKKKSVGLKKLVDAARNIVDDATKPAKEGEPRTPISPEAQSLVDEAKAVLKRFGADKDAALTAFEEKLTRLANGEGKLSDAVDAARAVVEGDAKPTEAAPKVVSAKARLKAAAKRLVDAADNVQAETRARDTIAQKLMDTARQAVGLLRNMNVSPEITAFRDALASKDPEAAAAAAQRLIDAEGKKTSPVRERAPVEYDQVMSAARRVANAMKENIAKPAAEMMPDIKELVTGAREAASQLGKERESVLGKLIDQAERQAIDMAKQKEVKEPTEALPPELQALVDKTKRIVDRFGGTSRGEKAALLLARTGRTFAEQEQLARSVYGLTPNQVAKVLNKLRESPDAKKPGWLYWIWQQGLISGLVTHSKYLLVNTGVLFLERTLSPLIANAIGKVRGEQVSIVGPLYANVAMIKAIPDALSAAAQAFKTGMRIPLESEMRLFERGEESPQTKGASSAYMQSQTPEWGIWNRIFNETQLDAAAKVLGIPGRSANLIHTFYKVLSERAAASNIAFQTAFKEGARDTNFWQRYQYHLDNPTDAALRTSVTDAYTGAFMASLGPKLTEFSHALSKNPITKWFFPFQHIPWNIQRMTFEYSPLAILGPEMRSALLGEKGAPAQNLAVAKMVVGSSVIGYFVHKGLSGEATGHYPKDPAERRKWELLNIQPNSIKIGGRWVSMERIGPIGNIAILGASIGEIIHDYDGRDDDALTKATWAASMAAANQIGNEVGFQSLRNLIDALENPGHATRYVATQAASFVPYSSQLRQDASFIDPYERKATTFIDGLKYSMPGARETLIPKRDPLYGEPVANPGYHTINRSAALSVDPVRAEMEMLKYYPAAPESHIGTVKLPPRLDDKYQELAGGFTKVALQAVVNQPGWGEISPFAKVEIMARTISAARGAARAKMIIEHPEILDQTLKDLNSRLNNEKKGKLQ